MFAHRSDVVWREHWWAGPDPEKLRADYLDSAPLITGGLLDRWTSYL